MAVRARALENPAPDSRSVAPIKGVVFHLFHTLVDPEEFRPPEFSRARFTAEFFDCPSEERGHPGGRRGCLD